MATEKTKNEPAGRTPSQHFPGVAARDIERIERIGSDMTRLASAMKRGDMDTIREVYPRLRKVPREAERIIRAARRAFARDGSS